MGTNPEVWLVTRMEPNEGGGTKMDSRFQLRGTGQGGRRQGHRKGDDFLSECSNHFSVDADDLVLEPGLEVVYTEAVVELTGIHEITGGVNIKCKMHYHRELES